MTAIDAKNTTGNVTLVASTVDTVTLDRAAGENPLHIDRSPYIPNELGLVKPPYRGFRIVNNDASAVIYYTVSYNNNAILTPTVGGEDTYRLNGASTDQWICDPETPSVINVKLISEGTPIYNVEAW